MTNKRTWNARRSAPVAFPAPAFNAASHSTALVVRVPEWNAPLHVPRSFQPRVVWHAWKEYMAARRRRRELLTAPPRPGAATFTDGESAIELSAPTGPLENVRQIGDQLTLRGATPAWGVDGDGRAFYDPDRPLSEAATLLVFGSGLALEQGDE